MRKTLKSIAALSRKAILSTLFSSPFWKGSYSKTLFSSPYWKGVYSKRKEFAPRGSKFYPFRVDPFSEGYWREGKQSGSHKSCIPFQKWREIHQVNRVFLRYMLSLYKCTIVSTCSCGLHVHRGDRQIILRGWWWGGGGGWQALHFAEYMYIPVSVKKAMKLICNIFSTKMKCIWLNMIYW